MRNDHVSSLIILTFVLILVCARLPQQPDDNNPMDRNSPDYIPPQVQITSVVPDTISSDSITISWTGNEHIQKTSYYLAGYDSEWSAWDTTGNHLYTYLDEKSYCFYVKGIYANSDSSLDSINFTVNTITDAAIIFTPQKVTISQTDSIQLNIALDNIPNINAIKIKLDYPKNSFTVSQIKKSGLISTTPNSFFFSSITDSTIIIEIGVPLGIFGNGTIASLIVSNLTIASNITFNDADCDIRTNDQKNIQIGVTRGVYLLLK